ncbi:MAG: hypothetical protein ACPGFK_03375 [Flavobacteriaceae bacterium]
MELKQVRKYIDLYLEGNTSLAQEQALFVYFSQEQVDESLVHYKSYFAALAQQREQRFSRNFNPIKTSKSLQLKRYAAIAAAAIAGVFVLQQTAINSQPTPEEIAYEEFKANMYLVAEQLNKGKQGVAYIETFNQTTYKYLKTE